MPICVTGVEGNDVNDADGNRYLDFSSGSGVVNAGWQREEVAAVVKDQVDRLSYCAPWFPTREAVELSELLVSITPKRLVRCGRATGGADANELICRAAYALTGKRGVLTLTRSYHGGSRLAVNLSDAAAFRLPLIPIEEDYHKVSAPDCFRCPLHLQPETCGLACAELVEEAIAGNPDIGLFLCEPVMGSGGVILPPPGYLHRIQAICRAHDVVFALDEVMTGFGRLGWMTAAEGYELEADAISFGKALGGGMVPIGAAVLSEELATAVTQFEDVSPTFAWTPLACAAATANIHLIIEEDLPARSQRLGATLLSELRRLFATHLAERTGDVRGQGLMVGIELVRDQETKIPAQSLMRRFVIGLVREGLMVKVSWDFKVIILMPPLNLSEIDLERGLGIIQRQLQTLESGNRR